MGTVVDIEGCVDRDVATVLQRAGLAGDDAAAIPGRSEQRLGQLMADVTAGRRNWQGHRELRRLALRETLADHGLPPLEPALEAEASRGDPSVEPVVGLRRSVAITAGGRDGGRLVER